MQRKRVGQSECPVARCVDQIGDWWSILILRDALQGTTRFDAFQKSLEIAPTILTRRLKSLVDDGLLEKHRYCDHPPREEYQLTEKGRDFQPVLFSLLAWGNKHFAPEGKSLVIFNDRSGSIAEPALVDQETGDIICGPDFRLICGPAASTALKERLERQAQESSANATARQSSPKAAN
ncbi:winged helix-turn-helix transcriptional regulator [Planctomicrobium sp. SH527]|uniref:winged helix-turn-helix transcriptional regulator n=1 Tax=Planctomicrobium sp. SH527 TaxID=3448123 RepID=UPI003F5C42A8